ncbi:helix-turn-helix domain-containing protein [Listeria ivanovii]|uniref:Putative transcriptional regulator (Rgg family) n=1 Tax=Listeria ivanovii (strain ATCC BAA-678 / PAM 55) TaxID=881621 RepID=G2ZCQ0_LISIP|nr:Rgg/GadR/MutR family transcriptional regulator [Listeria ivanovii]AHI56476.1 transcriptional activator [Listeria ivanovii WSLC3009]AIS65898.1 Rgg family transcriptional regulator [Listeria ivanovii subsp. ivanovii]MBC1759065.1 Rgg family transcriptional regulator [Listeria ivanovii]MBK3914089.1 Rgg family transcriptional regulator [Listeria ivanovii subsp. ivanovii]MBK3921073.1 Rgg family transcriptional regulator [Listeria ivanovii subsp. ivanovii]
MNKYGKVVRDIRISKGISQKKLYEGIISKSYAIEFEKGAHEISLNLFEKILTRINMNMDEFFFILRGFSLNDDDDFWYTHEQKGTAYDINSLYDLYEELSQNEGEIAEVRKALVHSRMELLENLLKNQEFNVAVISEQDIETIQNYLFSIQSWTLEEIKIFANSIYYFDEEIQSQFLQQVLKSVDTYKNYDRGRRLLCALLINTIEVFIQQNKLSQAKKLLTDLENLSIFYEGAFYRILSTFLLGLINMKSKLVELGYYQAQKSIRILKELNYDDIALLYDILLTQFLEEENLTEHPVLKTDL